MIRYLLLTGCLLYGLTAWSQVPVADFSASKTEGCAPLVVTFKDLSTNTPKFWNWDLGNGQLSNLKNPTSVYSTPGTYTVILVVRNADGTNGITKTNYITVNPSPRVAFTSDRTVSCLPATIQFTDQSVANAGTLTTWKWDFGDGTSSSLQNPQKVYETTGFYTVTLRATSSTGCNSVTSKNRYIRILSGVTADFTDSISGICQPPFYVNFNNETSGPGTLSHTWNLGNGTSSSATDPTASYNAPGDYTVQLISKSSQGCSDTTQKKLTVTSTGTSFSSPDSACLSTPVTFQNTSSPVSATWDFGDGTFSTNINAEKVYNNPGDYRVKLVNTYIACKDSITKTIRISSLAFADFAANTRQSCQAPLPVSFQDLSKNAVSWNWDFGDGSSSTENNPTHTYNDTGKYDVRLTVINNLGCENTVTKAEYIRITAPVITISNAPAGGCIPFTFKPVAAGDAIDGISSYLWDFGQGGATSTLQNPQHTYPDSGSYTLKLTVTTNGGCTASVTVPDGVRTGPPPVADFSTRRLSVCAAETVSFIDLSHPADQWLWQFGEDTDTQQNPSYKFKDTGRFTITLTAFNNGCGTTVSKQRYVEVRPPISLFVDSSDCVNDKLLYFKNRSTTNPAYGAVSYLWEFGDPANSTSTEKEPTFTYPAFGNHAATLTVKNGVCSMVYTKRIYLYAEKAAIRASKTTVCKHERFTITDSTRFPENIARYEWTINGGTPFIGNQSFDTSFAETGQYTIRLTITDNKGCSNTQVRTGYINVIGPDPKFAVAGDFACRNAPVTINDLSAPADKIVEWTFNFGDGTTESFTGPAFTHQYNDTGVYNIQLVAKDQFGCTDTAQVNDSVRIIKPIAAFRADKTLFCPGGPLQFIDSSSGSGLAYSWQFGDGGVSGEQHPVHVYTGAEKQYTVQLTVTDTAGCTDVSTRNNYVEIRAPKPAFDIKDTASICPPLETKFFFKGSDYESFYWDFGDDGGSTLENPTHFYNAYGTYTAKLYLVGYGGCLDSAEHKVNLYNPYRTTLTYSPLIKCNSLLVDFSVQNAPARFTFYFGDGTIDSSQQKTFQHLYSTPGSQRPYIILKDSLDCQVQVSGSSIIKVLGAEPLFSPDRKAFCDQGRVYFTNYTIGNDPIVSRLWDFDDGTTSTDEAPIHDFKEPGRYLVSLTVTTRSGCSKSITDTIRVYNTPEPSISSADVVCINAPAQLLGTLAQADTSVTWSWNVGNGETYTRQNPKVTYTSGGSYAISLEAANALGCKNAVTKNITVAELPSINMGPDQVIPIGAAITLPVTYSPGIATYAWSPIKSLSCAECPVPVANPTSTTKYTVNVTDSNGCANTEDIMITVVCNNVNYFVPNSFSPNGDGNNDVFFPRGTHLERIQSMRIFNRWGEMVFEKRNFAANNAADGWNGLYKGRNAQADAYVYIIEFICENNAIIPYKGNVTLIR